VATWVRGTPLEKVAVSWVAESTETEVASTPANETLALNPESIKPLPVTVRVVLLDFKREVTLGNKVGSV
jgi:hypothetical protein